MLLPVCDPGVRRNPDVQAQPRGPLSTVRELLAHGQDELDAREEVRFVDLGLAGFVHRHVDVVMMFLLLWAFGLLTYV
jgi:hypothetical protein